MKTNFHKRNIIFLVELSSQTAISTPYFTSYLFVVDLFMKKGVGAREGSIEIISTT